MMKRAARLQGATGETRETVVVVTGELVRMLLLLLVGLKVYVVIEDTEGGRPKSADAMCAPPPKFFVYAAGGKGENAGDIGETVVVVTGELVRMLLLLLVGERNGKDPPFKPIAAVVRRLAKAGVHRDDKTKRWWTDKQQYARVFDDTVGAADTAETDAAEMAACTRTDHVAHGVAMPPLGAASLPSIDDKETSQETEEVGNV